ncbi:hypothetical protein Lqui_2632 [Legionella quinlivanii]|uniref:Uncharacterized protein n=1 Tax=Legionella quinlivanii TaxID=45073 RepID=A0A0W0XNM5_9GAMM|nr:hypothetical protein [Legionella quinlivanii]KTD46142.1 hypothetical protein Lqui_2632 [Legionella quinlivanii]MCW8451169.1 hypothetical protein [Legionella quinlivanii]SEG27678.1 hypothetical protein SAMN02746093_02380 [Legionella quinlivanii DSM 21216]STY10640.1 Uncharacterised protein [Legionella quinlivanii]
MPNSERASEKRDFNLRSQKRTAAISVKSQQITESISYETYCAELLAEAIHVSEVYNGLTQCSGAQFKIALIGFGDRQQLEKQINPDLKVDLPEKFDVDMNAGFEWLDLAVSYGSKEAKKYFRLHIQESFFRQAFCEYRTHRADNHLEQLADIKPGFFNEKLKHAKAAANLWQLANSGNHHLEDGLKLK